MIKNKHLDAFFLRGIGLPFPCIVALEANGLLPFNYNKFTVKVNNTNPIDYFTNELTNRGKVGKVREDGFMLGDVSYRYEEAGLIKRLTATVDGAIISVYKEFPEYSYRVELDTKKKQVNTLIYGKGVLGTNSTTDYAPIASLSMRSEATTLDVDATSYMLLLLSANTIIFKYSLLTTENNHGVDLSPYIDNVNLTGISEVTRSLTYTLMDGVITDASLSGVNIEYTARVNEETNRLTVSRHVS